MSEEFSLGNVEVSLSPLQRFEEYLQSRGMRMTQQRRCSWIMSSAGTSISTPIR